MGEKSIFAIIVLSAILILGISLWYYNLGGERYIKQQFITEDNTDNSLKKPILPQKDGETAEIAEGLEVYYPSKENIHSDDITGRSYIDSQLRVASRKEVERAEVDKIISVYGGKVVAENTHGMTYTIVLDKIYSEEEMEKLAKKIHENHMDKFRSVRKTIILKEDAKYIPNDKEWGKNESEWSNIVGASGKNWGVEAINVPEMWDCKDKMEYVNVGIIHEDLHFSDLYQYDSDRKKIPTVHI